jgi:Ca-activated chloride channel family protein
VQGFSLEHPWVLTLFLFLLLCKEFCKPRFERYYIPHLEFVLRASPLKYDSELLKWAGIVFLLIALSSPVYNRGYVTSMKDSVDIVLTLDLSGSMRYPIDNNNNSRFDALQEVVEGFIDKRKGDRIALVAFASTASVAAPLTFDTATVKKMLQNQYVGVVGERTAIYDALFQTYLLLEQSDAASKVVVLFTDGINNESSIPKEVIETIIKQNDARLYIVGLGVVDEVSLQALAKSANGDFFKVGDKAGLEKVYATIDKLEKSKNEGGQKVLKSYYYIFFLFLALLSFLIYLYLQTQKGLR